MDIDERIEWLYAQIIDEIGLYEDYVSERLKRYICEYHQIAKNFPEEAKGIMGQSLYRLINPIKTYMTIWLYSCCIAISYDNKIYEEFLHYAIDNKEISANTRYFIYYQLKSIMFQHIHLETWNAKYLKWKLLEKIVFEFKQELKNVMAPIPKEQRNDTFALVITEQMLSPVHGPTKTALDRCKALMQTMGKTVLLVNTAEILSHRGEVSFFNGTVGNYDASMLHLQSIPWKGIEAPYFQCEANMPNIADVRSLLQMVQEMKPGTAISIGGSSIVSNLINDIIPVLTVGLGPSDLEATMTKCQTLSRPLEIEDKELLYKMGLDESSVIESIFTSSLKPQERKVTRKEMGLPEDKFVIAIVGVRLDTDIDQNFADMLKRIASEDICIALIGQFISYEQFIADNPKLQNCMKFLGMTDDILSWFENCDLYLNPHRKGGGTSGVEAAFMGIPVVTTLYGDVAVNVGSDFWVESYEEMPEVIMRYKKDPDFYRMMSNKVKKRAEVLLDTEREFVRIVKEFKKRCD